MSEVRGSGQEYQTAKAQERPRGATLHLRSRVGGWGPPRGDTQHLRSGTAAGRSYPMPPRPRPRAAAGRSNPTPEIRGSGQEDQPHVQGAVAAQAQEVLEELSHVKGQEGWR